MLLISSAADGFIGIMFVCKYTSEQELNMADMFSGQISEEIMHLMYRNENYLKALESWLPFLEQRGYLNKVKK
jgi:hypothetical protein